MTAEKIITVGKIRYIAIRGYSISRIIVCIETIIELIFKILKIRIVFNNIKSFH